MLAYVNNPEAQTEAFDIQSIPKVSRAQAQQESARPTTLDTITASVIPRKTAATTAAAAPSAQETQSAYSSQLAAIPEFETYGALLNSSAKPIPLTESETEYVVTCVKHIYKEHVVFQVSNTYCNWTRLLLTFNTLVQCIKYDPRYRPGKCLCYRAAVWRGPH